MREIKLLAWDKDSRSLRRVEELCFDMGRPLHGLMEGINGRVFLDKPVMVDGEYHNDYPLLEFIGLSDMSGNEIYSGYLLSVNGDRENPIQVEYSEEEASFYGYELNSGHSYYFGRSNDVLEVIGNIYEQAVD